ncbi:hypothetical protein JQK15_08595 [Sphingobium sp. BHU LFT2]|uniref:hypothetical protein n=1 Tax=Sphingobium sp. BHU LFT2 TaxID=2807634 RepID=UPI001BE9575E|nr:hypothetical protein [Sphingobium sp. BHU LFT2]MBT2243597.1 hypothetical protein [Sphingobium sp. BHU LFT2]
MSSAACVAFCGLRYEVTAAEVDQLERNTDPRQILSKQVGLSSYWGNFGGQADRFVLFVGKKLTVLGPENDMAAAFTAERLLTITSDTAKRLKEADLRGEIGLFLEWLTDA